MSSELVIKKKSFRNNRHTVYSFNTADLQPMYHVAVQYFEGSNAKLLLC
ncbi:hypothetical protein GW12_28170 [Acinetobacter sp. HR7]|nr:hypothetical protein GW12_28170 [Acinetobacter sp. HR7]